MSSSSDQLPAEIWYMIFKNLDDMSDLLKCRLVNSKWCALINSMKVQSLDVAMMDAYTNTGKRCLDANFEFTNEPLHRSVFFETRSLSFLGNKSMRQILSRLKRLSISSTPFLTKNLWSKFESALQSLGELEQLQIFALNISASKERTLSHPNLKIIAINDFGYRSQDLLLDTPNLSMLSVGKCYSRIRLNYPNQITHLKMLEFNVNYLNQFKNLQFLYLKKSSKVACFDDLTVGFPKLKEVYFSLPTKPDMVNLIKQKRISRNLNLKLYFSDFHIDSLSDVEELFGDQFAVSVNTQRVLNNYDKLSNVITYINGLNYSSLIDHFDTLPIDIHSRFVKIRKVWVSKVMDSETNFVRFIKNCKCLRELNICNSFNQAFYEDLHVFCPFLSSLKIEDHSKAAFKSEFLYNFKYLETFGINKRIDFVSVKKLFFDLSSLNVLGFLLKGKRIELENGGYRSCIRISNREIYGCKSDDFFFIVKDLFELAA